MHYSFELEIYSLSLSNYSFVYLILPGAVRCAFATLSFQLNFVQSFLPEISELSHLVRRASSTAVARDNKETFYSTHALFGWSFDNIFLRVNKQHSYKVTDHHDKHLWTKPNTWYYTLLPLLNTHTESSVN